MTVPYSCTIHYSTVLYGTLFFPPTWRCISGDSVSGRAEELKAPPRPPSGSSIRSPSSSANTDWITNTVSAGPPPPPAAPPEEGCPSCTCGAEASRRFGVRVVYLPA